MKQVTQRLRDGRIDVLDVPLPALTPDGVLVDVRASVISTGTERAKVQTGRQSLLGKARSRPDQVRQVVDKAKRDGVRETVATVRTRLEQPSALGYSAAGVVLAVGERVRDVVPGERVACGGAEHAVHADVILVPGNLCVPIPGDVDAEHAAFATVGSIALHGVRQADVRLGEKVAVVGLGLVGQLAGKLLRAAGCDVLGIDLNPKLVEHAVAHGAATEAALRPQLDDAARHHLDSCDAVVITAATRSPDPVRLAAALCRDRGTVVVVGDVALDVPRAPYYDKELDLRLSRSYGPGRYDRAYEERGLDYPIGYVRWTERRNMAAFLRLLADGRVGVEDLISERVPIEHAAEAYERLVSDEGSPLGVVLRYAETPLPAPPAAPAAAGTATGDPRAASLIGAGSFAQRVLIPALASAGFRLDAVASGAGLSAHGAGEQFGFARVLSTDDVVADAQSGTIVISTRHSTHASLAAAALRAGKAVFVEKPPAMDPDELRALRVARDAASRPLAVGFNRRHSPLVEQLRGHVAGRGPMEVLVRVNAGSLPPDHWLNDLDEGGGRLVGEGCHFVDLACWLAGGIPERVSCIARGEPGEPLAAAQRFSIALDFADGSTAAILYGAAGATGLGKEYVEAHAGERSGAIDDFRSLRLAGGARARRVRGDRDKGHRAQLRRFLDRIERGAAEELDPLDTMAATFAALRSAEVGCAVALADVL